MCPLRFPDDTTLCGIRKYECSSVARIGSAVRSRRRRGSSGQPSSANEGGQGSTRDERCQHQLPVHSCLRYVRLPSSHIHIAFIHMSKVLALHAATAASTTMTATTNKCCGACRTCDFASTASNRRSVVAAATAITAISTTMPVDDIDYLPLMQCAMYARN